MSVGFNDPREGLRGAICEITATVKKIPDPSRNVTQSRDINNINAIYVSAQSIQCGSALEFDHSGSVGINPSYSRILFLVVSRKIHNGI